MSERVVVAGHCGCLLWFFFSLFSIRVLLFLLLVGVFVVDFSKNQNKREMKVKKKIET